jgi:flavin-dependent dehydrogenase
MLTSTEGKIIQSKLILGATGSNSSLSKQLGNLTKEDEHFAVGVRAYFTGVECEANVTELFLDRSIFPGGLYISPMANNLYNVNIVVRKDIMHKRKMNLKAEFDNLIASNKLVNRKFKNATRVSDFKGSGLFLGTRKRAISGKGFMLLGDSAGLIDLISANGIPQAMISGRFAADKAMECVKSKNFSAEFMKSYDHELYAKIDSDLSIGKLVNPILSFTLFHQIAFAVFNFLGSKNPNNSVLVNVLYANNHILTILNPVFYFNLLMGSNNRA